MLHGPHRYKARRRCATSRQKLSSRVQTPVKHSILTPLATFWRIHINALIADPARSTLAALGVAIGVTVLVAVTILASEVQRPFDAYGPALTGAASNTVTQITPQVLGRLPETAVSEIKAIKGVQAAVPVVSGLTEMVSNKGHAGVFVIGSTCEVELLVGDFNCTSLSQLPPEPGAGIPLTLTPKLARILGVAPGDTVRIPGLPDNSAHVGWIAKDSDVLNTLNAGFVVLTPDIATSQGFIGSAGFLSNVFVTSMTDAVRGPIAQRVGDFATVGPPKAQMPTGLLTVTQSLSTLSAAGLVIGVLIAVITVLLAIEDRRSTMGTVGALGMTGRQTFVGLLGEGAILGIVGGVIAIPFGMLLGQYLTNLFGSTMLSGTGAQIESVWSGGFVALSVLGGLACGILAVLSPARSITREGPLASMQARGGPTKLRIVPPWLAALGLLLATGTVLLLIRMQEGRIPASFAQVGFFLGVLGTILIGMAIAQPLARRLAIPFERLRAAEGTLLRSDLARFPILFAAAATTLAIGAAIAIGFASAQSLGARSAVNSYHEHMPTTVLASPEGIFEQRDSPLSPSVIAALDGTSGLANTERAVRSRAQIPTTDNPQIVVGIDGPSFLTKGFIAVHGNADQMWSDLQHGSIALSKIAAGRLNVATGDSVELQTPRGMRRFNVAGIFSIAFPDNTASGNWILATKQLGSDVWGAELVQAAYDYPSVKASAAGRKTLASAESDLVIDDLATYEQHVTAAWARTFRPFTVTGYVIMFAAAIAVLNMFLLGLLQRRRERAVLRAIGMPDATERRAMFFQAILLAAVAILLGIASGLYFTWIQSITSPVFLGFQIQWGIIWRPIVLGAATIAFMSFLGLIIPLIHSGQLDVVSALRDE